MSLVTAVVRELVGMFVADLGLTLALLAVVAGAAGMIDLLSAPPLAGGVLLTVGTLAVLLLSVRSAAARRAH